MTIEHNIEQVQANIAAACARVGRDPSEVTLVAVSKTHGPDAILRAIAAGVQHFGENRVEEAEGKIPKISPAVTWHMIGHIQSRKAKVIPALFQVVHSVDRLKVASRLSQATVEAGKMLDVLLEVNVSGEASKDGLVAKGWQTDPEIRARLWREVEAILALPGLNVRGLMTMAPNVADMQEARPVFAGLAGVRMALAESLGIAVPDLSMGMTDDYPVAVEEGATIVRVGRAIFGIRGE